MTVYICGDSTAASYTEDNAPVTGWGQMLGKYLPGVRVENRAFAGRSTKSFLADGRLQKIETEIAPGDLLLIQFTHNDGSPLVWRHTDPWTSFLNNLSIFADTALQCGARPVMVTPICQRNWRNGELQESLGEYPEAIRVLARRKNLPLIDLYRESRRIVAALGKEESKKLYMHVPAGIYPRYMNGQQDDTHTQRAGAEAFAAAAAEEMKKAGLV